jgi:hypothetical protein
MRTLTYIMFGLTAWTGVSVIFGLGLGAVLGFSSDTAELAPAHTQEALRNSA